MKNRSPHLKPYQINKATVGLSIFEGCGSKIQIKLYMFGLINIFLTPCILSFSILAKNMVNKFNSESNLFSWT